jgi:glyoxylase-like metal-dependent hydrolase (beta-lactamase superfamily II)
LPDFKVRFFYGHTEAMMAPLIRTPKGTLLYCADAMPSQWHIGMPYVMAYDIRPLQTMKEKAQMLETAVREKHTLFFEHDPIAACGTVWKENSGRIVLGNTGALEEVLGR